jgi:hypothetical protein
MKYISGYSEYIKESLTDKVFHFTYINRLENILDEDVLQTTPVMGTRSDGELNKNKFYFLSTTTSRHSDIGYAASLPKSNLVRLNLNGQKLNNNYKAARVDYWQRPKDPKDPMYKSYAGGSGKAHLKYVSRQDELEDRLMTDEPVIKNAHKYIDSISVLFEEGAHRFEEDYRTMINCLNKAKELNIPIYFYDNQKSFDHELKDKAIDITKLNVKEPSDEYNYKSHMIHLTRTLALMFYADSELREKLIEGLKGLDDLKEKIEAREITFDDFIERIDKRTDDDRKNYLFYINDDFEKSDYPIGEYISVISSDIHNAKSKSEPHRRYISHELAKDMRKHGAKNIFDYIKYKVKLGHDKLGK